MKIYKLISVLLGVFVLCLFLSVPAFGQRRGGGGGGYSSSPRYSAPMSSAPRYSSPSSVGSGRGSFNSAPSTSTSSPMGSGGSFNRAPSNGGSSMRSSMPPRNSSSDPNAFGGRTYGGGGGRVYTAPAVGMRPYNMAPVYYNGGYYRAYSYGGWSDYSLGWAHPAFFYTGPQYVNGYMYPGEFSWLRLFMAIAIFVFLIWLISLPFRRTRIRSF